MNETNWSVLTRNTKVTQESIDTLARAKKMERKFIRNGGRWIQINKRISILVECDKKGIPTKKGEHRINKVKEALGIIKPPNANKTKNIVT